MKRKKLLLKLQKQLSNTREMMEKVDSLNYEYNELMIMIRHQDGTESTLKSSSIKKKNNITSTPYIPPGRGKDEGK